MRTSTLRVNQLTDEGTQWYFGYLETLDRKDVEAYADYLDDGVTLEINNGPAVEGKDAVVLMLTQYWQSFGSLEHELTNVYGTDEHFVLEALNHYTRHDGAPVTVHAVAFTDRGADGRVTSVRLYGDTSPLFT